jgi:hypothetical protein
MPGGRRIRTPCRGRTRRMCNKAKKACLYASGTQKRFCRKRKNTRRRMSGGKWY